MCVVVVGSGVVREGGEEKWKWGTCSHPPTAAVIMLLGACGGVGSEHESRGEEHTWIRDDGSLYVCCCAIGGCPARTPLLSYWRVCVEERESKANTTRGCTMSWKQEKRYIRIIILC